MGELGRRATGDEGGDGEGEKAQQAGNEVRVEEGVGTGLEAQEVGEVGGERPDVEGKDEDKRKGESAAEAGR